MAARPARTALQSHASAHGRGPGGSPTNTSEHRPLTVALVGHRGAGKTELAELLLERARVVREAGTVADGTTLLDSDPTSRAHRQTLELGSAWFEWEDRLVQLLDTPGASFCPEMRDLAIAASDLVLVVVDASAGIQHGTRDALASSARHGVPALLVVTKADRLAEGAELPSLTLGTSPELLTAWLTLPFHDERGQLCGVIDAPRRQVLRFADDRSGAFSPEPVPAQLIRQVDSAREALCEAVAASDDALLEQYLEYFDLPDAQLDGGLVSAVQRRAVVPALVACPTLRIGAEGLLAAITRFAAPFGARVPRCIDSDGAAVQLGSEGPFLAQVLSTHVDADGSPYNLVKVWSGRVPKGEWLDTASGRRHRPRKWYRVRGPTTP
jgi:elongation factor G